MNKKQILAFVITLMVLMTSFNFGTTESKAANADYKQLSISNLYTDRLDTSDDVNYYKFDIQTGYFTVDFMLGGAYRNDAIRNGWELSIYDSEGKIDSYFLNDNITTKKYAYPAGTYYVVVKANSQFDAPVGLDYKIRVNNTASNDWEREYNDEWRFANKIVIGQTISGNLTTSDDIDVFELNMRTGYFTVDFMLGGAYRNDAIRSGWELSIYDAEGKIDSYSMTHDNTTQKYAYPAGTYYVVVKANSQFDAPVGLDYKIRVNNTASNDWEREYNDEANFANKIATNKTIKGNLIKSDGRDYFKFQIKKKKNIKIQFSQLQKNTSDRVKAGWNVTLYDSGFKKIQEMTVKTKGSTPVLTLNSGTYYVVVKANSQFDAPVGLDYKICVCSSDIPKSTSITAVKGQKKAVKISWKAVKNVDGYKIYRSTKKNGTYKKIATVKGGKKNTYKNTKLKSGKMYYYKIKTYKKQNSITSESSFSKIKSARAK